MPTDPSLLRITNRSGLQLETTPGTASTPGQTYGGEFQIGEPSRQVGKSSQEALYGTLSEIAENVLKGVNTASKINRLNEDTNWENFLKNEWEGPNSLRLQLLDPNKPYVNPQTGNPLTDEETYNTIRDILDKAPSRGVNSQRRSALFGNWLEEDPDRREIFKRLSAKFNKENEKLSPNEKLNKFEQSFKYFIEAQVPETMQEFISLKRNQLEYNTNLALASFKINTTQYLANFNLVLKGRQQEKLGNTSFMNEVKKQLGDITPILADVDRYLETPTYETLRSIVNTTSGRATTKTSGEQYDAFEDAQIQIEDELTTQFQRTFDEQNIDFRVKYEDRIFNSAALTLLSLGFTEIKDRTITPDNIRETGLKLSGLVAAGSGNSSAEQVEKINKVIVGTFIEQARRSRLDQTTLVNYAVDSWKSAWQQMTPLQRKYVLQANLIGSVIDPKETPELAIEQINNFSYLSTLPDNLIPKIKTSVLYKFEQTQEYGLFINYQLEGVKGKLPAGPYVPGNSTTIKDALQEIRKQNGEGTISNSSSLQSLFEIGLGQELYTDTLNARLLWSYGLGYPIEDYDLWLQALEDPTNPAFKDIVERYNVKKLDKNLDQQTWINTEPSLLKRSQNEFIRSELRRFYTELGSQVKDSSGSQEGLFTPSQQNDLSLTGNLRESQRTAVDILNNNIKARGVADQIGTIWKSIEFGNTVKLGNETYTFSFAVPVGYKDGQSVTPLPSFLLDQIVKLAQAEEQRLKDQPAIASLALSSTNPSNTRENSFRALVSKALFDQLVMANPDMYIGNKPETRQQQALALNNFVNSIIQTETEFQQFFSPLFNNQDTLVVSGASFLSQNGDDNDLSKLSFPLVNENLDAEGSANYARLVFRIATSRYTLPEIKDRLKTALNVFNEIKDGEDLASRLQANPEHFFFLHGIVSGIIEKASRRVQANQLSEVSLDSAIQAEISTIVDSTDSSRFSQFLRAYALYVLKDNTATVQGGMPSNFRTQDPNQSLRMLRGIALGAIDNVSAEETSRLKALQMWLNVAVVASQSAREQETARSPVGPGFEGTLDTQFTNPIYRIRTLFSSYSPSVSNMMVSGTVPREKESREDGINTILTAYEQAGIKIKGNTQAEKYENLLINLSRMNGGKYIVGRAPNGGPETTYILNVREPGGLYEGEWSADTSTGATEQPFFFFNGETTRSQNLGSTDPTNAVLHMQESLGSNFIDFLNLVVPSLAKQGSVKLEDLVSYWEDYSMLSGKPNNFTLIDQESVLDFTGRNEVLTGTLTKTEIPGEFEVWYHIANFHPPIDFQTRDEITIDRPASFGNWFGIDDAYRPPTTSTKSDTAMFSYLFGPRDPEQRTQESYQKDIERVLSVLNITEGRFRTNQQDPTNPTNFDPGVKEKITRLAQQLFEENKQYGRALSTGSDYANAGTLTNAYMFLQIKRVFFGDNPSDPNETFLPALLFETGNDGNFSQGLLAGNRESMFRIEFPPTANKNNRTPFLRQFVQKDGPVTRSNPSINTGIPLIPELMPNYRPLKKENGSYTFTGNNVDSINLYEDNLHILGRIYSTQRKNLSLYRHPWAYIKSLENKNIDVLKTPSYIPPTTPATTVLPPTPL